MVEVTVAKDTLDPSSFRVEAIMEDGGVEVAIFGGPNAFRRATMFTALYYGDMDDAAIYIGQGAG